MGFIARIICRRQGSRLVKSVLRVRGKLEKFVLLSVPHLRKKFFECWHALLPIKPVDREFPGKSKM